jgi:hypothetical protein
MPSFQYFLYLREQKKSHWGLDPVNTEGVPEQLFVYYLKTPSDTVCSLVSSFGTIFAHTFIMSRSSIKIFPTFLVDVHLLCYAR